MGTPIDVDYIVSVNTSLLSATPPRPAALTVGIDGEAIRENPRPSMGGGDGVAVGVLAGALIVRSGDHDGVVVDGLLGSSPAARSAAPRRMSKPSRCVRRVS
jgi:hypothetical protein